jgi:hypothetical protein
MAKSKKSEASALEDIRYKAEPLLGRMGPEASAYVPRRNREA